MRLKKITIWLDNFEFVLLQRIKTKEKKTYREIINEYIKIKDKETKEDLTSSILKHL